MFYDLYQASCEKDITDFPLCQCSNIGKYGLLWLILTPFPLKIIKNLKNTINIALSFKNMENSDMGVKKRYGERIRTIRGSLTQAEFGKIIGKSATSVSEYELEDTEPDMETWIKIADYSKTTIDWLMRGIKSDTLKDNEEKKLVHTYREMEKLDPKVAERYKKLGEFELGEIKETEKDPPTRKSKDVRHKKG